MDTSFYLAFSAMRAEMDALDVAANNMANLATTGFREERPFFEVLESAGLAFARMGGSRPNVQPGPLVATGRDLDVAIEGDGFLVVQGPGGRRYTRNGGLQRDGEGRLVTRSGLAVLGQGGPITLPPTGAIEIDTEGRVLVDGVAAGRILLVRVPADALGRDANGLFVALREGAETPATEARLRQGFLEASNVDPTGGSLSEAARHFQALGRALAIVSGLKRRLISAAQG